MGAISLEKLMEGRNPYKVMLEETKGLVNKWKPTGLLEGLQSDQEVHGMAILLENQSKQVIEESTKTGTDSNSEQWVGVALPLVRRVFGEIAAKEFVSVQPMNLPAGLVFYLDFKYGAGGTQPGFPAGNSLYGGTGTLFGRTDEATGGLYDAGRFGYSINDVTSSIVAGAVTASQATWKDVRFDPDLSASVADNTLFNITFPAPSDADLVGVRAFKVSGSYTEGGYFPRYTDAGVINSANYLTFTVSSSANLLTTASAVLLTYQVQPTATSRGDFEDKSTAPWMGAADGGNYRVLDIPEIDLQLKSEPIVAKTRKLKAVWTPEMAQDLNAFHSVDAEAELTSMLSEYISMEIDLEILDMLIQSALTVDYWTAKIGYEWNSTTNTFQAPAANVGQFYTRQTWYQTLGTKIQKVSNRIHQKTMRGGANFLVCSPDVATILESIPGFTVDTDGDKQQFAMGVSKVGSFANRFQVYKNPYMKENIILMGFKGSSFLESGAVYAPYIPLISTPLVYDPNNLTPRKGVMTRYAKKVVRPEFYGLVVIGGMEVL
jgi:hypothetical protein